MSSQGERITLLEEKSEVVSSSNWIQVSSPLGSVGMAVTARAGDSMVTVVGLAGEARVVAVGGSS